MAWSPWRLLPLVGWVESPGDYAAFKFPPLPRHDPEKLNIFFTLSREIPK